MTCLRSYCFKYKLFHAFHIFKNCGALLKKKNKIFYRTSEYKRDEERAALVEEVSPDHRPRPLQSWQSPTDGEPLSHHEAPSEPSPQSKAECRGDSAQSPPKLREGNQACSSSSTGLLTPQRRYGIAFLLRNHQGSCFSPSLQGWGSEIPVLSLLFHASLSVPFFGALLFLFLFQRWGFPLLIIRKGVTSCDLIFYGQMLNRTGEVKVCSGLSKLLPRTGHL